MKESAGCIIIHNNRILLLHPTGSGRRKLWGIPKGGIEKNETQYDCAIRETKEEVGIDLSNHNPRTNVPIEIKYTKPSGYCYKKVWAWIFDIKNLKTIGLKDYRVPIDMLQLIEVDRAEFFTKEEAQDIIFWRFKPFLDLLE